MPHLLKLHPVVFQKLLEYGKSAWLSGSRTVVREGNAEYLPALSLSLFLIIGGAGGETHTNPTNCRSVSLLAARRNVPGRTLTQTICRYPKHVITKWSPVKTSGNVTKGPQRPDRTLAAGH